MYDESDQSIRLTIEDLQTGAKYVTTGPRDTQSKHWGDVVEITIERIQGMQFMPVRLPVLVD